MTSDIPTTLRMASETSDQPHDTGSAGPGRTIRQSRERARLSLEELAKETRLARATLEALERDDFSTLTEPVYVRGYYRKCAKVLNLSENELIASYDKLFAPKSQSIPTKLLLSNSDTMSPSGRRGGSRGMLATVVVVAVLTAAIWFVTHDPSRFGFGDAAATGTTEVAASAPAPTPIPLPPPSPIEPSAVTTTSDGGATTATPATSTPAASLNLDATLTSPSGTSSTPQSAPQPGTQTAPPSVSPSTAGGASPAPATLTPSTTLAGNTTAAAPTPAPTSAAVTIPAASGAAASSGPLVLSFKSSSWVRIEDADGRLLLSGTIQAGDRQQLSGRAPYALFLGYAPGVSVEYNGRPIDTTPFVRQNSTARISVPLPPATATPAPTP